MIRVRGVTQCVNHLRRYDSSLPMKNRIMLNRLSQLGVDVADVSFATAAYDGVNDVSVSVEWVSETKLKVCAEGNSVLFIEFGTGVHYGAQHPRAAELGMIRGTYGKGNGSKDQWGYYYNGGQLTAGGIPIKNGSVILTHGNPPSRSMYSAYREMRESIFTIAKEVYGND